MTMPHTRVLPAIAAILCAAALSGCASTGSHSTSCSTTEVSPNSQPGASTPRAALDAYLKVDRSGLPKSGYTLEGHHGNRYVYVSGKQRVSLSKLPGTTSQQSDWVVLLTFDCT